MANIKLRVTGMTCGHCQAKVEKALKGVTGVYSAVIDLPDGEAEVDFDDDSVTTDQLVAAIAQAFGQLSSAAWELAEAVERGQRQRVSRAG